MVLKSDFLAAMRKGPGRPKTGGSWKRSKRCPHIYIWVGELFNAKDIHINTQEDLHITYVHKNNKKTWYVVKYNIIGGYQKKTMNVAIFKKLFESFRPNLEIN